MSHETLYSDLHWFHRNLYYVLIFLISASSFTTFLLHLLTVSLDPSFDLYLVCNYDHTRAFPRARTISITARNQIPGATTPRYLLCLFLYGNGGGWSSPFPLSSLSQLPVIAATCVRNDCICRASNTLWCFVSVTFWNCCWWLIIPMATLEREKVN